MLQKIALVVASAAATLTLAIALAAAGFAPGGPTSAADTSATTTTSAPAIDPVSADATPDVQIDTIYVAPPPKQQTVTVHRVIKASGGERENEHENEGGSGGDD